MIKNRVFPLLLLGAVCALWILSSAQVQKAPVQVQKNPQIETQQRAVQPPVRNDAVPVLERRAENAPEARLSVLLESLSARHGGKMDREKLQDRMRAVGPDWRLDVFGDGSGAEFLDQAAANRAHEHGVEPSKAMSAQALEQAGRAYIERHLSKVIVLAPGERLVPVATSFRTEGGIGRDGRNPYSAVVANRVMFGREINGIPVVGAGSKVTITFLNDGAVESFRYDWPVYAPTGRTQQLAPSREVLQRVQRVAGIRTNTPLAGAVPAPPNIQILREPVRLGDRVQLQDLTCGYYDPGFMNRDQRAPVQAGCYYHVVHTAGSGEYITTAGYSGAVPSAVKHEPDARWPEANVLSGNVMQGPPPARQAGPSDKIQPVPPRPKEGTPGKRD